VGTFFQKKVKKKPKKFASIKNGRIFAPPFRVKVKILKYSLLRRYESED
jgi:hypothetical protein